MDGWERGGTGGEDDEHQMLVRDERGVRLGEALGRRER